MEKAIENIWHFKCEECSEERSISYKEAINMPICCKKYYFEHDHRHLWSKNSYDELRIYYKECPHSVTGYKPFLELGFSEKNINSLAEFEDFLYEFLQKWDKKKHG